MIDRQRAVWITGVAFPLGSLLGLVIGRSTMPAATGGGFGDIVYVLMWYVIGGPLLSLALFFWTTRGLGWSPWVTVRSLAVVLVGTFIATAVQMLLLRSLGGGGSTALAFVALPLGGLIVALFARQTLRA